MKKEKLVIAKYEIIPILTGQFGLDGGSMFGTVPKVLWEKSNPPDDKNRIPMEARALLLKSKNLNILIDCGNGADFIEKYGPKLGQAFSKMYGVAPNTASLEKSLNAAGLTFDDIHHVILTHLHFDHAGGATRFSQGQILPTFPNAKYHLQKKNLATAQSPNLREKASYLKNNFLPLIEANVLVLHEGQVTDLFPGVSLLMSDGHTTGQQLVKITDQANTLLYCADVIPTSSHIRLAWVMGYDLRPLDLIEEKRHILTQAATNGWKLFFEHDAYCDAVTVAQVDDDFLVKERFIL
jgi:glyoxylase-like metal-dependent hydrolase (beta-lactamase superfamily II)